MHDDAAASLNASPPTDGMAAHTKRTIGSAPNSQQGRFFQMEFSPLRNPRSLSNITTADIPGNSNMRLRQTSHGDSTSDPVNSAATAYGASAAQKVKQLEDLLTTYPIHHGANRGPHPVMTGEGSEELPTLAVTKRSNAPRGLASTIGGAATTLGGGTQAATNTAKDAAARKQRMDAWLSVADRSNAKLRTENEVLEKLALVAQENSLDNDAKYEVAIDHLRNQLQFAQTFRQDSSEVVRNMDSRIEGIQVLISELVTTAERRCHQEHEAVHAAFQKQLEQQKEELERVRENGKNTTHDWKAKNMVLQEQLERVMQETQSTYEKLSSLQAESQRLRVEFSAQSGDADILQKEYRKVYSEHQRLKDRLHSLEAENASGPLTIQQQQQSPSRPPTRTDERGVTPSWRRTKPNDELENPDRDYEAALRRVQILFETEAAHLKAVREAHLHTLRNRTELEVFLRQIIVRWKASKRRDAMMQLEQQQQSNDSSKGRARRGTAAADTATEDTHKGAQVMCTIDGNAPVAFYNDDRKKVIDQLLSTPRVLQILFGPNTEGSINGDSSNGGGGAGNTSSSPMKAVDSVASPKVHETRELGAMFDQWREWTERANHHAFSKHSTLSTTA